MIKPEKPLQQLLDNQVDTLPGIKAKIKQLTDLNNIWQTQLDSTLAQHCRVANFREKCLIIEVDSSAWATRLRYLIPELLKSLRSFTEFTGLQAIEWYIQPPTPLTFHPDIPHKRPILSADSKEIILETAKNIGAEKLKKALRNLAGD